MSLVECLRGLDSPVVASLALAWALVWTSAVHAQVAAPAGAPEFPPEQGVVRLERAGRVIGLGMVLGRDGRVVTALSALGHGNQIQGRFAGDQLAPLRVVASDRGSDLALLEPDGLFWTRGLRPSSLEPDADGVVLTRYRARGRRLESTAAPIARRLSLLGRDGAVIDGALSFATRVREQDLGSPVLDAAGQVVAVMALACAPSSKRRCRLEPYGAPVSALRAFLKEVPRRPPLPAAFLGFRGTAAYDQSVAGVRVSHVHPGGPADRAGLEAIPAEPSDLIVAVNGEPVATWEELTEAVNRFVLTGDRPGDRPVPLLVYRGNRFRNVELRLPPTRREPDAAKVSAAARSTAAAATRASAAAGPAPPRAAPGPAPPPAPAQAPAASQPPAASEPRLAPTPYEDSPPPPR